MSAPHWARLRPLLELLLEAPEEQRTRLLDEHCGDDAELRAAALRALLAESNDRDFLELSAPVPELASGARLGPWRLLEQIGVGGMGVVWLAERADGEFEKRVAVKLLRSGFASPGLLARFAEERRVLARLAHPNIARVLDAGVTDEGISFLVMEHVEGTRIDRWCDERRLGLRERVALMRAVCAAISHAHHALVVHRDLKPSNVLVSEEGVPVLLDFGIAKVLDPGAEELPGELTATELRLLTPGYASPEQVRGEPITTRSDVYSLGILLYELLCGRRPYSVSDTNLFDMARIVCEEVPLRASDAFASSEDGGSALELAERRSSTPRRIATELAGDLDTIAAVALSKDAERRYASAEALDEDLRRYLEGLPVLARPDSLAYRARKFARRNRAAVTLAAALAVALVAGTVFSALQWREAESARALAEGEGQAAREAEELARARFDQVRALARELLFDVYDEVAPLQGATAARRQLAATGLEYLDGLAAEAADDGPLLCEIAEGYVRTGDVLGRPGEASLGDTGGARASYQRARRVLEGLVERSPAEGAVLLELARVRGRLGELERVSGETEAALSEFDAMRTLALAGAEAGGSRAVASGLVVDAQASRGDVLFVLGRTREAIDTFESMLGDLDAEQADAAARRERMRLYARIGDMRVALGELGPARAALEQALAIAERLAEEAEFEATPTRDLAWCLAKLGVLAESEREDALAAECFRRELDLHLALRAADPADADARRGSAEAHAKLANVLRRLGEHAEAEQHRALAQAEQSDLLAGDPDRGESDRDLARTHLRTARARLDEGRASEACEEFERGLELLRGVVERDPEHTLAMRDLCYGFGHLLEARWRSGDREGAVEALDRWLELARALIEREGLPWDRRQLFAAQRQGGAILFALGVDESRSVDERARALERSASQFVAAIELVGQLDADGVLQPGDPSVASIGAELARCEEAMLALEAE